MVSGLRILVSGCSIAGPAAAYWLHRGGNAVTVIERSRQLPRAGQNIDVRGTGREVLRRMGLEEEALARNTGEIGTRFVGDDDRTLWELPAGQSDSDGMTGEVEILRGELSELLVGALHDDVTVRFGERITEIDQDDDGATVTLHGGARERFDLVVIAEGTRSSSREMVFGEVPTKSVGLYTVYATIPRSDDDDRWWQWYNTVGGRSVTVRPDNQGTTRVALSFLSTGRDYESLRMEEQKEMVTERFADVGWKTPRILDGIADTDELYVDYITQVFAPVYRKNRVVLLGDAAWCATPLSGLGTTLALTGACVLAGELAGHNTIGAALHSYQQRMTPFVAKAQRLPPGGPRLAHPRTPLGLAVFRMLLRVAGSPPVRALTRRLPTRPSDAEDLPRYSELRG